MAGSAASQTVTLDGHRLRLTHPDKVMYPETGTTKAEIIAYLVTIAPVLLPHLDGRIVTRKRWVHGVGTPARPGEVFFEKNLPSSAPRWIRRHRVAHDRHDAEYPLVEHAADLAWFGQVGALELHTPQWRVGDGPEDPVDPPHPDRLVLDLDPGPGAGLAECAAVAHEARAILGEVGLEAIPVTSGSKGLHLYAALDGAHDTEYVNAFAKTLTEALQSQLPDLVVSSMAKSVRRGKVLVDWSQNNGNKTTIAPYSLRGTVLPHVAAPRQWDEIDDDLTQLMFSEVLHRVQTLGDPLADLGHLPRTDRVTISGSEVQLASVGREATVRSRDDWAYEMKWDGIRAVAQVHEGEARILSRNGNDLTVSYPEISEALSGEPGLDGTVLDGEIVAFGPGGAPDFGLLQHRMGVTSTREVTAAARRAPAHLLVFDLLAHRGQDLRDQPYTDRREALEDLDVGDDTDAVLRIPPAFDGALAEAVSHSLEQGLEGVIAKRRSASYRAGRGSSWVKIKHQRTQDVVICGWCPGRGTRDGSIGSLVVAVHRDDRLSYAGRVGTGFTDAALQRLAADLSALEISDRPLADVPDDVARTARWVDPVLVGEVSFAEWTSNGHLRHASWRGVRPDIPASGVRS